MKPGDKVRVVLSNGYKTTGVIVRKFKNGRVGVREKNGKYHIRSVNNNGNSVTIISRKGEEDDNDES